MRDFGITVRGPFVPAASGRVTGLMVVDLDGCSFPDTDWRDFVPVVLGWWLEALDDLVMHGSATFRFMDGPYEIRLMRRGHDVLLDCVVRSLHSEAVEYSGNVPYARFRDAFVRDYRAAVTDLMSNGYEAEADELTRMLAGSHAFQE